MFCFFICRFVFCHVFQNYLIKISPCPVLLVSDKSADWLAAVRHSFRLSVFLFFVESLLHPTYFNISSIRIPQTWSFPASLSNNRFLRCYLQEFLITCHTSCIRFYFYYGFTVIVVLTYPSENFFFCYLADVLNFDNA